MRRIKRQARPYYTMTKMESFTEHLLNSIRFGAFMALAFCAIAFSVSIPIVMALVFFPGNPIAMLIGGVVAIFLFGTTMMFFMNY